MRPGLLRHVITITPTGTLDKWGQRQAGEPVRIRGDVRSVKASDKVSGSAILSVAELKIYMRYRAGLIDSTITFDGQDYAVIGVEHDRKKRMTIVYAKSRQ